MRGQRDGRGTHQVVLTYDGSFPGFLCAAADFINASRSGGAPPTIRGFASSEELFDETFAVRCDEARATRLWRRLSRKAGEASLQTCMEAFLSDLPERENSIARALARMDNEGGKALDAMDDPDICLVVKAALRAKGQAHLLKGLIRFSELADGSWYAPIEPDCDVLSLLGDHFAARYPDMRFAIHDRKRNKAILHLPGSPWRTVDGFSLTSSPESSFSERERAIQAGWVRYFDTVAIAPRRNPRLQSGHMPKKYWHLLPEMKPNKK
ncbi:MAG TPA: TIGR03915 family putative DNA repair protein [Rectinemataceae bacterium]|nr:TIGR03915 family putative DNA repair protein [Rectinemataceae bacterium]